MADPVGLIGQSGGVHPLKPLSPQGDGAASSGGPGFKDILLENLEKVNAAQREADRAVEDLVTGKRDDLESVIIATEKADGAFKMLQAMRNKVMEAYDEISQVRV